MAIKNNHRPQLNDQHIKETIKQITNKLKTQLSKKGKGIFISSHECLGILKEEFDEYSLSVHNNNMLEQYNELLDIAVASIISIASMKSNKMDKL